MAAGPSTTNNYEIELFCHLIKPLMNNNIDELVVVVVVVIGARSKRRNVL